MPMRTLIAAMLLFTLTACAAETKQPEAKVEKKSEKKVEVEGKETVPLETKDYRYASYFAHVKRKIQLAWRWPEEARKYTGAVILNFVLRQDGTLVRVELLDSSGHQVLDDAAMEAVKKAAPFNSFPPAIKRELLPIKGRFVYRRSL